MVVSRTCMKVAKASAKRVIVRALPLRGAGLSLRGWESLMIAAVLPGSNHLGAGAGTAVGSENVRDARFHLWIVAQAALSGNRLTAYL